MDGGALVFRTVIVYVLVVLAMRFMGKREIGKLSVVDLIVFIMIAEIAVFVIEETQRPLMNAILPIATLVAVQVLAAVLTMKSQLLRRIFEGSPSYLIKKGVLDREEMRKNRYNLDDLMVQLRQHRIHNVADVEFAILETSGKLTVLEKKEKPAPSAEDDGVIRYAGLPLPLIMDGKVQDANLAQIGRTRFWLKNEVQKCGIKDFKEIFLCSIDHRGMLFIGKKGR